MDDYILDKVNSEERKVGSSQRKEFFEYFVKFKGRKFPAIATFTFSGIDIFILPIFDMLKNLTNYFTTDFLLSCINIGHYTFWS